ncbi:MAG: ATP-binding protein [Propionibacterium sp.]|nr:ATP-binding protein [Propionibacterium sp.]
MEYIPRIVDEQLAEYLQGTRAVSIEGPRAVGKTATASRVAKSKVRLDDPATAAILGADRAGYLRSLDPPALIDEWQLDPPVWDTVRRLVDDEPRPGRFILTGSADLGDARLHPGAARFLRLRMRPLSFAERQLDEPTVSLAALWDGERDIGGHTPVTLRDYAEEIVASGFPAVRTEPASLRLDVIADYLEYAIAHDVPELGGLHRQPAAVRAWLRPYAAATSSTASLTSIAGAASREQLPSKATIAAFRDVLARLWLLDELPAWSPAGTRLTQVMQSPKHHLADPAFAASLLGTDADGLVLASGSGDVDAGLRKLRDGPMFGALFESLVTLSLRVYATALRLEVRHLRTHRGDREIDLILQGRDGRIIAVEVKLAPTADDRDVRHLHWLQGRLGDQLIDRIVVSTGTTAYRRRDGVAVVPLALLGP